MSTAENKVFASRILEEVFNQGNLNQIDEFFSPDIVIHDPDKELRADTQAEYYPSKRANSCRYRYNKTL